jgi:ribosomal protein S25
LGQKEKKNKEEKMGMGERKRKEEEEQGEKKNTKGVCVILKMNRKEKICRKLLLFVQI